MAYEVPALGTAGQVYTAAAHNIIVNDVLSFRDNTGVVPAICKVRRAANQSIPTGDDTFIIWDTEEIDTNAMFAASSDTVTIKTAGVYQVSLNVFFASSSTGQRIAWVTKNPAGFGVTTAFAMSWVLPAVSGSVLSCSGLTSFAVNDTIKCVVHQTQTTSLNITDTGNFTAATNLSVVMLGATT